MKTLKCILFSAMCCLCSVGASAQSLGDILGSLGEGLTVSAVLKNPNMQSADMKNFFAFINAGHSSFNEGKYGDAVSHYSEARKIVNATNDKILQKVYLNYGVKAQLDEWYSNAYTQYKLHNPSQPVESSGSVSGFSGGGFYTAPSTGGTTTTQTKTVCRLCGGTGRKIKEFYSAGQHKWCATCNREVGTGHQHVTCDLCHGTGSY